MNDFYTQALLFISIALMMALSTWVTYTLQAVGITLKKRLPVHLVFNGLLISVIGNVTLIIYILFLT